MIRFTLSLLLSLSIAGAAVIAEDWESRLKDELDVIREVERQRLSFVQTMTDNDGTEISRYHATQPQTWRLLQVDGKEPTERQQKEFRKQREQEQERRADEHLSDLIASGSVRSQGLNDEGQLVLSFTPFLEDMPDSDALQGIALWAPEQQHLVMLRIYSPESFSPRFPVTIHHLDMIFRFQLFRGETVPARYDFEVDGKFAGLKTFSVRSSVEYSELELLIAGQ